MARLSYLPAEQQNTSSPTDTAEATCSLENIMLYKVHLFYQQHDVTPRVSKVTEEKSLVGMFVFPHNTGLVVFEFHSRHRYLFAFVPCLCPSVCS
jgi:hypothetical protein